MNHSNILLISIAAETNIFKSSTPDEHKKQGEKLLGELKEKKTPKEKFTGTKKFMFTHHFRICVRPNPRENYTSIDTWFMPQLMQETIVLENPENLAKKIRGNF